MRVLVTGSRNWDNRVIFRHTMMRTVVEPHWDMGYDSDGHPVDYLVPRDFVLVHGACLSGADVMAGDWMAGWNRICEEHPANWNRDRKRAGFIRNAEMVALGADLCLAFWRGRSAGTKMTIDLAESAGIPTLVVEETARATAEVA